MKIIKKLLPVLIIFTLLISSLVACQKIYSEDILPTSWTSYLSEISEYLENSIILNDGKFSADISADLTLTDSESNKNNNYKINILANIDFQNIESEANIIVIELNGIINETPKNLLRICADNKDIYVEAYNEVTGGELNYKFPNAPIFTALSYLASHQQDEIDISKNFYDFGLTIFSNCIVDSEKKKYEFKFNFTELFKTEIGIFFEDLIKALPEDFMLSIYNIFGAENRAEMLENFTNIEGGMVFNVNYLLGLKTIESIEVKNYEINTNGSSYKKLSLNITKLIFSKEELSNVLDFFPKDLEHFDVIKIATFSSLGQISLIDKNDKNIAVTYDYKINCSLDLIQLLKSDFNFSELDDKNYFHLRISHICNDKCGDFCSVSKENKFKKAEGSVVDIAFSPKDFNTKNIYISFSIPSLVGKNSFYPIIGKDADLMRLGISDYQLLTLDTQIRGESNFNSIIFDELGIDLLNFIPLLGVNKQGAEIDLVSIIERFKDDNFGGMFATILESFTLGEGYNIGVAKVESKKFIYGQADNYDIANETLHIIDQKLTATKKYDNHNLFGRTTPSFKWEFNDKSLNSEKVEYHTFYDKFGNVLFSDKVRLSPTEVKSLIGGFIEYDYWDIYSVNTGSEKSGTARTEILAVEGLDLTDTKNNQKVKLKLALPSSWLPKNVVNTMKDFFNSYFFTYIEVNIKLTEEKKNSFRINYLDKATEYKLNGYEPDKDWNTETGINIKYHHKMLQAIATLEYEDGFIKKHYILGEANIFSLYRLLLSSDKFAINKIGKEEIIFNVFGREEIKKINILKPNETEILNKNGKYEVTKSVTDLISLSTFNGFILRLTYDDIVVERELSMNNFYIKGTSLSEDSNYWSAGVDSLFRQYVIFNKCDSYNVKIKHFGAECDFVLNIQDKIPAKSTYIINSKVLEKKYFNDYFYFYNFELVNKSHGSGGLENQKVEVNLYKGYISNGNIQFSSKPTEPKDNYVLDYIKIDGINLTEQIKGESGYFIDIPQNIFNPIKIDIKSKFLTEGYFRIKVKIGSAYYNFDFQVLKSFGTINYDIFDISEEVENYYTNDYEYEFGLLARVIKEGNLGSYKIFKFTVELKNNPSTITHQILNGNFQSNVGSPTDCEEGIYKLGEEVYMPFIYNRETRISLKVKFFEPGIYIIRMELLDGVIIEKEIEVKMN